MRGAVIIMSFAALASYAQHMEQEGRPVSVCELLTHREDYNGRLVTVRGEVKGSSEGTWLEADPDCNYKLVTRGVVWPRIVFLAYPNKISDRVRLDKPQRGELRFSDVDPAAGRDASADDRGSRHRPADHKRGEDHHLQR